MSRLTHNALKGLLAALLFALAINIAEQTGKRISDQRLPDAAAAANPLSHKIVLH